jgi:hypothetical protein
MDAFPYFYGEEEDLEIKFNLHLKYLESSADNYGSIVYEETVL